jgi:hypothetical protein
MRHREQGGVEGGCVKKTERKCRRAWNLFLNEELHNLYSLLNRTLRIIKSIKMESICM